MKDLPEDVVFSMKCENFKSLKTVFVTCEDENKESFELKDEDFILHEDEKKRFLQVKKKLGKGKHSFRIEILDHDDNKHDWTSFCLQKGIYTSKF